MSAVKNKELLMLAINDYDLYSINQRNVLKVLVDLAVDDIVKVSGKTISTITKVSFNNAFIIMRRLNKDGFIIKMEDTSDKVNIYKLNHSKLGSLVKMYQLKKEGIN